MEDPHKPEVLTITINDIMLIVKLNTIGLQLWLDSIKPFLVQVKTDGRCSCTCSRNTKGTAMSKTV
jgi:hypothetical protein